MSKRSIDGFTRVGRTAEEMESGRGHRTGIVRCDECGQRIEASGMGIGSHRRKHARERQARR
jgi:hypothetical protein